MAAHGVTFPSKTHLGQTNIQQFRKKLHGLFDKNNLVLCYMDYVTSADFLYLKSLFNFLNMHDFLNFKCYYR